MRSSVYLGLLGIFLLCLIANAQVLRDEDIDDTSDMDPNDADYKDHNHREDNNHDIRRYGPYNRNGNGVNRRKTAQRNSYDDTDLDHSNHNHRHLSTNHGSILLPAIFTSVLWVLYSVYMVI